MPKKMEAVFGRHTKGAGAFGAHPLCAPFSLAWSINDVLKSVFSVGIPQGFDFRPASLLANAP